MVTGTCFPWLTIMEKREVGFFCWWYYYSLLLITVLFIFKKLDVLWVCVFFTSTSTA